MAASLSTVAAKDSAGTAIAGGLLAVDKSGAGSGPFFLGNAIIDMQGVNVAAVKAASTAPGATDPALVVAISPNSVNANGTALSANSAPVVPASDWVGAFGGNIAHDAVDSGNPVKGGHKATTSLAGLTLVANADRTESFAGVDGVQITRPHCNLEDLLSPLPVAITDGSSTSVMASAGAGVKNYVTTCIIANTSATAVTVDLRDGAAGAVKATFPVPANTSGVVCNFPVPIGFSAATAVCADPSAAASTITVTLIGFKSKV